MVHTTNLRKVGGSTMLAVPRALLDHLNLHVGAAMTITVDGQRLIIEPEARPRYTLEMLLAQCDPDSARLSEDQDWAQSGPLGGELI